MKLKVPLFVVTLFSLIGWAAATTNQSGYQGIGVTMNGPYNILLSLGLESTGLLSTAQVVWWYNIIAMGIIFIIAATASERNLRFFYVLVPVLAALEVWFGWLKAPNPTVTFGIIIGCALLAAMMYLKDTLRENWGIGGPGTTMMNIAVFLILFQVIVTLVNNPAMGLFGATNAAPDGTMYQSINLNSQFSSMSDTGGIAQALISAGSVFTTMMIGAIVGFVSIIQGALLFSQTIIVAFPVVQSSPLALGLIYVFQVGEWILFAFVFYQIYVAKSPWVEV